MKLIDPQKYDAVLFDLDGVLTDTAQIHAACWKKMFDQYLQDHAAANGQTFTPFDSAGDYQRYVDGKLRNDGVRAFLDSRGIQLPQGEVDDAPEADTICGLGNRKNAFIQEVVRSIGVEVFEGSLQLVRHLREVGIKTAVVSASRNCLGFLRGARIVDLFDTRIDGEVAAVEDLAGKPAPDTFLAAAKRLGVQPSRAVVFEDAIAGVQAGRAGGFGLVVGVARKGDAAALKENGADIVVSDLGEMLP